MAGTYELRHSKGVIWNEGSIARHSSPSLTSLLETGVTLGYGESR